MRKSGSGRLALQMYTSENNSVHLESTAIGATVRSRSAAPSSYG
ncbi:hypothetical protein [Paenibacillus sp. 19GGS1-52]|nr:hypothetical protein [Paenibacillus sp. 19GGS1-52]